MDHSYFQCREVAPILAEVCISLILQEQNKILWKFGGYDEIPSVEENIKELSSYSLTQELLVNQ